eukprot:m.337236 g.337236  ORF g.337236 m.337236 type:complete len:1466 (+) comp18083_c0_seq1:218-4615(+)
MAKLISFITLFSLSYVTVQGQTCSERFSESCTEEASVVTTGSCSGGCDATATLLNQFLNSCGTVQTTTVFCVNGVLVVGTGSQSCTSVATQLNVLLLRQYRDAFASDDVLICTEIDLIAPHENAELLAVSGLGAKCNVDKLNTLIANFEATSTCPATTSTTSSITTATVTSSTNTVSTITGSTTTITTSTLTSKTTTTLTTTSKTTISATTVTTTYICPESQYLSCPARASQTHILISCAGTCTDIVSLVENTLINCYDGENGVAADDLRVTCSTSTGKWLRTLTLPQCQRIANGLNALVSAHLFQKEGVVLSVASCRSAGNQFQLAVPAVNCGLYIEVLNTVLHDYSTTSSCPEITTTQTSTQTTTATSTLSSTPDSTVTTTAVSTDTSTETSTATSTATTTPTTTTTTETATTETVTTTTKTTNTISTQTDTSSSLTTTTVTTITTTTKTDTHSSTTTSTSSSSSASSSSQTSSTKSTISATTVSITRTETAADGCCDYYVSSPWVDSEGDDCTFYSESNNCERYGGLYRGLGGKVAKEACCACGGGATKGSELCRPFTTTATTETITRTTPTTTTKTLTHTSVTLTTVSTTTATHTDTTITTRTTGTTITSSSTITSTITSKTTTTKTTITTTTKTTETETTTITSVTATTTETSRTDTITEFSGSGSEDEETETTTITTTITTTTTKPETITATTTTMTITTTTSSSSTSTSASLTKTTLTSTTLTTTTLTTMTQTLEACPDYRISIVTASGFPTCCSNCEDNVTHLQSFYNDNNLFCEDVAGECDSVSKVREACPQTCFLIPCRREREVTGFSGSIVIQRTASPGCGICVNGGSDADCTIATEFESFGTKTNRNITNFDRLRIGLKWPIGEELKDVPQNKLLINNVVESQVGATHYCITVDCHSSTSTSSSSTSSSTATITKTTSITSTTNTATTTNTETTTTTLITTTVTSATQTEQPYCYAPLDCSDEFVCSSAAVGESGSGTTTDDNNKQCGDYNSSLCEENINCEGMTYTCNECTGLNKDACVENTVCKFGIMETTTMTTTTTLTTVTTTTKTTATSSTTAKPCLEQSFTDLGNPSHGCCYDMKFNGITTVFTYRATSTGCVQDGGNCDCKEGTNSLATTTRVAKGKSCGGIQQCLLGLPITTATTTTATTTTKTTRTVTSATSTKVTTTQISQTLTDTQTTITNTVVTTTRTTTTRTSVTDTDTTITTTKVREVSTSEEQRTTIIRTTTPFGVVTTEGQQTTDVACVNANRGGPEGRTILESFITSTLINDLGVVGDILTVNNFCVEMRGFCNVQVLPPPFTILTTATLRSCMQAVCPQMCNTCEGITWDQQPLPSSCMTTVNTGVASSTPVDTTPLSTDTNSSSSTAVVITDTRTFSEAADGSEDSGPSDGQLTLYILIAVVAIGCILGGVLMVISNSRNSAKIAGKGGQRVAVNNNYDAEAPAYVKAFHQTPL